MSLQDLYYLTNIIFMALLIILLIVALVFLFYIKKKISELSDNLTARLNDVKRIATNPGQVATEVGTVVAANAMRGVTDYLKKKAGKKKD